MFCIAKVRLGDSTRKINTKSGIEMRSAWGFADVDSEQGMLVGVVAFGDLANELSKYGKGQTVRVSGVFKRDDYKSKSGEEKKGWQIVADGIAGVKSARGKYSTPKPKADDQQERNQATSGFYEDKLSF